MNQIESMVVFDLGNNRDLQQKSSVSIFARRENIFEVPNRNDRARESRKSTGTLNKKHQGKIRGEKVLTNFVIVFDPERNHFVGREKFVNGSFSSR